MPSASPDQMIVKANKLVQAKMPLSKLEHRVVAMLISQLDKNDEEFGYQRLAIKDLIEQSGKNHQALYHRAEGLCQSLLDKKLEIKRVVDGKREYEGINLMAACKYKEGDGYIRAKFNEEMGPHLLQLKRRFTMYEAGYYVPLRSTHSMRVYELLKMREGVSVLRISVGELRDILGLQDKYEYFSHLEHHVIKKAQEEIDEKTDVSFTYDKEKDGRSVERVKFFIHSGEEEPRSPTKIEDRTKAPEVDVTSMFLADLSQEEIDGLDEETLDSLHEKAVEKARRENPNRSENVVQAEAYRHMKALWER